MVISWLQCAKISQKVLLYTVKDGTIAFPGGREALQFPVAMSEYLESTYYCISLLGFRYE